MILEDTRSWAQLAGKTALERKGEKIVILDMREVTLVADYFVIVSGHTVIQVAALADHIEEAMKKAGISLLQRVGGDKSHWILLDYGAVVVHIFTDDERHYYDLERLWGDADLIALEESE
ncbi:MAG: ribosome silencing factor [Firmicutes bacterium]|jgi:ribosome-associated protein|uniref:Ribosomal silencing factor RsfS n=1 Tax=Sulfobacillus benefaciens TaxID=453960 RepID=A0A2T2WZS2_9FIRM|nr:ribosome silencing factor [Bacillota bacterium]MCL5013615.1 ribosome silencing factor [Bacillota bacterium]PSR27734.1 MAG: ribosome silencing factor [Sulfobacillus benefaciens]HBQ94177.1 ribosome silencing factor [Sulfobacillus sp.]